MRKMLLTALLTMMGLGAFAIETVPIKGSIISPTDKFIQYAGRISFANPERPKKNRPTIVGHPDKIVMHNRDRYFTEDEPWYRSLALETIHLIKELNLICEINTRGIYKGRHADYYPGKWLIQEMKALRIPVIVSTDAHAPEDLLRTEGAYEYLAAISYPEILREL